jgi:indolepyruvate ferredoxin oxidoreductase
VKLNDKYTQNAGSVYLTGIQALVRLPMDQMRRDRLAGLKTAALISGYEGSPLGSYDLTLSRVPELLREHNIHFVPGMNEDIAATSVFGSQIFHVLGQSKYDGVVGIWYGKGPGVDRSGDIFRHANLAGTGRNCAALALGGDDHISKSSTIPHQSDISFYNVGMPLFYPGSVQEVLDYGLLAIALSRFSGAWSSMKMVTNVCDAGGTVDVDPARIDIGIPEGYEKFHEPLLLVPFTLKLEYEVNRRRLDAALQFARLNRVNRMYGAREAWLGIATAGKSYYDLQQTLRDFGIRRDDLEHLGIRIAKFGMTFPLEPEFAKEFASGLQTIFVVEEKRSFIESQLKDVLYNLQRRPLIVGKRDTQGETLLRSEGELNPEEIARALAKVLADPLAGKPAWEAIAGRLKRMDEIEGRSISKASSRHPNFCSGCPHNRSTVLLEGQMAGGGIGCHALAAELSDSGRGFAFLTHMGGEGAAWIGIERFIERQHIFQNIGDGTYFHSGQLALRACVAAGVNITYKILYNSTVAMTGGQNAAGALPIPDLTRKLEAEGVKKTIVLSDDTEKYDGVPLAGNAELRSRDELPGALRELEQIPGVTVIIYDQRCAAEKRRDRSRGKIAQPTLRLLIHEEVCEGCGDCVRQSNCMSLYPVATELGQKTRIHQPSCNMDYSCALGDCPSFVTINLKKGAGLKRRRLPELSSKDAPPAPQKVPIGEYYAILGVGIGGTGVVTVHALLAAAAWIDGISTVTLDQTGMAQKGGAVVSSTILSERPIETAARIGYGNAGLLLGFDLLGAASRTNLSCAHPSKTVAVVNTAEVPTGDDIRGKTRLAGPERAIDVINTYTDRGRNVFVDASRIAEELFGSHLAVNVFLLGVAYQGGHIPLSETAIEEAIRLNGVGSEQNLAAFLWGRRYYHNAKSVEEYLRPPEQQEPRLPTIDHRARELREYQNADYARQYAEFVRRVAAQAPELEEPVARYLYKLMAYKDEYEVARLLTKPGFEKQIHQTWEDVDSIGYNLHPPMLRALGWKRKIQFGQWFGGPLRLLARLKMLRGTPFDIFGYARIRRDERALIAWYRELIEQCLQKLTPANLDLAIELASLPDQIRGYEEIKRESIIRVKALAAEKLGQMSEALAREQLPVQN